MILFGVRWEEEKDSGFTRSEFIKEDEAIAKARDLVHDGKFNVNIKLVDTKDGQFKGDLQF
jgi:hypothetical protein